MGVASTLFARSTLTLFWTMGVMTMKMIKSTSMTSTMGVTLILELTFEPSFLTAIAMFHAPEDRARGCVCRLHAWFAALIPARIRGWEREDRSSPLPGCHPRIAAY